MTGMVKKSLFGMLGEHLDGTLVADLYCGTGTLGLEALSRGAERCWFAERDGRAVALLRRNIETLGVAERSTVWRGDVERRLAGWLAKLDRPLDVVFVDPPYPSARLWDFQRIGEAIFAPLCEKLDEDGRVVLRVPDDVSVPESPGGLVVARTRQYGEMTVVLLARP